MTRDVERTGPVRRYDALDPVQQSLARMLADLIAARIRRKWALEPHPDGEAAAVDPPAVVNE